MTSTVNQSTAAPSRKVTAAMIAGAIATVLAWGISAIAGVDVPPGVESAFAVILTAGAAYWIRERA
ncbi:hypothetical protein [Hyphobacterium sp.]|uniref:hypothetical protein n=1 Tax=Hyphobacterium sp. TaxID=2004662 RepID=UPI003B51BB6C